MFIGGTPGPVAQLVESSCTLVCLWLVVFGIGHLAGETVSMRVLGVLLSAAAAAAGPVAGQAT